MSSQTGEATEMTAQSLRRSKRMRPGARPPLRPERLQSRSADEAPRDPVALERRTDLRRAVPGASRGELVKLLNPEQLDAATTTEGPLLILAGAGSGKTRVLVHRAAYILHENRARAHELFCVTFTNKAAGEMRARLEELIGPQVRSAWIGTFHSLAARMLRFEGHRLGYARHFSIYDADDARRLLKKILDDLGISRTSYGVSAPLVAHEIDRAKNRGINAEAFARMQTEVASPAKKIARVAYPRYQNALRRANAMDFGDLLLLAVELLAHHPEAKKRFSGRFRYVMVDEFQDTNKVQYDLLKHLAESHENLAVVGDDDQSIYRWRGAEVANILGFDASFPGAKVVKLEQNYRSTQNILAAANAVIRQNSTRHAKELFTRAPAGAPVGVAMFETGEAEAQAIAQIIRRRLDAGNVPEAFAVLYRQNAQSRAFEESFRRRRIPYSVIGATAFYERREVKDILSYLRLLANPQSRADFERIVNVPPRKIGASTLERLRALAEKTGREGLHLLEADDRALSSVGLKAAAIKRLRSVHRLLSTLGEFAEAESAAEVARQVVERTNYLDYLRADDPVSADDRIANVEELVSSIAEHEDALEDMPTPDEPGVGLTRAATPLQAFLDEAALVSPDDRANTQDRVALLTLHSAKGLEFDIVFMVGLEESTFPSKRAIEEHSRASIEEERRLCYVGITRAREELQLTAARIRRIYGRPEVRQPSRFLGELPPEVVSDLRPYPTPYPTRPASRSTFDRGGDSIEYDSLDEDPIGAARPVSTLGSGLGPGTRVRHNTFGLGTVVRRDGEGPRARLTIAFGNHIGRKKVAARFVSLVEESC